MRGNGEIIAIACNHRGFPLSRRLRATLSQGRGRILSAPARGGSGPKRSFGSKGAPAQGGRGLHLAPTPPRVARRPLRLAGSAPPPRGGGGKLIPTPKTCERLLLDFREERRELSPLCPEVCGACPREGVTSRAPAGHPARSDGTKRPTRIPAGLETGARASGKSPRAGGRRLSHTFKKTCRQTVAGLPHTSHTARRIRRGAIRHVGPRHPAASLESHTGAWLLAG